MKRKYTNQEYNKYVENTSPKSNVISNTIKAFIVGGLICVIGQLIASFFKYKGWSTDQISSITVLIMIFLGALLTGLNIYDEIGHFAGAGSVIPITGFANSIVSPAMEFKTEGYVMGVGAKMFTVAGPILVYGILTSVISGVIYFIVK